MAENTTKQPALGIVVDDGRRRVPITNTYGDEVGVFYFNPTDINIIDRFNNLAKNFDKIFEPLENIPDTADNGDSDDLDPVYIDALNEARNRLNKAVDELFGADASSAFFGKVNPLSPVEGTGQFYCEIVLQAVINYISEQMNKQAVQVKRRVEKYTKRFNKR